MSDENINPHRAVNAIIEMAPKYAAARANRIYLEEYRKTLKATLMKTCPSLPIAAQEREAYADSRYVAHLEGMRAAIEEEENLRWMLVAAQARVEVWRSKEATARAEGRATQ